MSDTEKNNIFQDELNEGINDNIDALSSQNDDVNSLEAQESVKVDVESVASEQKDKGDEVDESIGPDGEKYLLRVLDLKEWFPIKTSIFKSRNVYLKAVDGVSFNLKQGKTIGIVGESGCGKTTLGRTILRLYEPTAGQIIFDGKHIENLKGEALRKMRPHFQMIFQDPYSSLSPRLTVGEIVGEAVRTHGIVPASEYKNYIVDIMLKCGLQPHYFERYPHEFSGGQRQRICIAKALALKPELVICDEPVSALDVSIQAQVINLFEDLQASDNLSYIFISHDLSVVEHISDEVGVMYLGNMVEFGSKEDLFSNPMHPYTQALFSAVPIPDPDTKIKRIILQGDIPSPAHPPKGCKFHTRCSRCMGICKEVEPKFIDYGNGHCVACHLYSQDGPVEKSDELENIVTTAKDMMGETQPDERPKDNEQIEQQVVEQTAEAQEEPVAQDESVVQENPVAQEEAAVVEESNVVDVVESEAQAEESKAAESEEPKEQDSVDEQIDESEVEQVQDSEVTADLEAMEEEPVASVGKKSVKKKKYDASQDKVLVEGDPSVNHGKFVIKKTVNGNFVYKLYSSNRRVLASPGGAYRDLSSCKVGIQSVINNAATAPIEDTTLKKYEEQKCPKWVIYIDKAGEVRLRLIASNGNVVAITNDGYTTKDAAKKGIDAIVRAATGASIVRNDTL